MNKLSIAVVALIIILIAAGAVFSSPKEQPAPADRPVSNDIDAAIRARVSEFGAKLKNVSLLMPLAELKSQMQLEYGAYVAPELLAEWQNNPAVAIGRSVSSPWPERIEVAAVSRLTDGLYRIEGNVIEITSADKPLEPAGIYPVTFTVKKIGTEWFISSLEKGAYNEIPHRVTVTGIWECLPHKNTNGPQTMECAFGIAIDQSDAHYALDLHLLESGPVDFPTGTHIRAEGILVPANQLNTDMWQKYPIDGIIGATSIEKI